MKPVRFLFLLQGAIIAGATVFPTLKSTAKEKPGIKEIRLVTDVSAVTPGESFTVALLLEPQPGYHTYWRGPGIVGVATTFEWDLPEQFSAGETMWPPPEKVLMAGITAYGFRSKTLLMTEIHPPLEIAKSEVTIHLKSSWMACSLDCNPGVEDLSLTLPVNRSGGAVKKDGELSATFKKIRQSLPRPAPSSWKIAPRSPAPDRIELDLTIPGLDTSLAPAIYFYCHDMQVDSDSAQKVTVLDAESGQIRLTLKRPEFAPNAPALISGVLHCPGDWPESDFPYVEISTPWPEGTFENE